MQIPLILLVLVGVAEAQPTEPSVATTHQRAAYFQVGGFLGGDQHQGFAAWNLGQTPLWAHAIYAAGGPLGFSLGGDLGDKVYLSGALRQIAGEREQHRNWRRLSAAQRLAWLWQAKLFARRALESARTRHDRASCTATPAEGEVTTETCQENQSPATNVTPKIGRRCRAEFGQSGGRFEPAESSLVRVFLRQNRNRGFGTRMAV